MITSYNLSTQSFEVFKGVMFAHICYRNECTTCICNFKKQKIYETVNSAVLKKIYKMINSLGVGGTCSPELSNM
jgi:hypothetical protein